MIHVGETGTSNLAHWLARAPKDARTRLDMCLMFFFSPMCLFDGLRGLSKLGMLCLCLEKSASGFF